MNQLIPSIIDARPVNRSKITRLTLISLMMCAGSVHAQSEVQNQVQVQRQTVVSEPRVDFILPQRRSAVRQATSISAVDVDVQITDMVATTHVQITVENPGSSVSQARLVLPVPSGSSIRTFGIDGIGDEPTAKLLPRQEATQRYNEIVRKMIDPGLLEFVGSAMIQSSVFPVEPGASRTMTIVYEQTLETHRGRVEYSFPRSASYTNSTIDWTFDVDLESTSDMGPVFSSSHPIISKLTSSKSMKVTVPVLDEPGPFRLYAMLGSEQDATTLLYPDPNDPSMGYFMFVADAPVVDQSIQTIPREITVVIDRSGSMGGKKIEQARESAKQIVRGMKLGEFVHIIDYAEDVRSFADGPVEITKESLPGIVAYIESIQSRGGTNLHGALMESLRPKVTDGHLAMVLFLTDGLASSGVTDESSIRNDAKIANVHDRRVFTFGVGYDVNVPLLDGIAMDTKGESTFVLPKEDVEMKVGQVFDKLDGPVIIDPLFESGYTVTDQKIDLRMIEPNTIGDLFSGSRVVILGQYHNLLHEPAQMWISSGSQETKKGADSLVADFFVEDASTRYAFVSRLWAQKRIDNLINQIRLAGADGTTPDKELVDEIVRLSIEHGVMSEYTAFLAEEDMGLADATRRDQSGRSRAARSSTSNMETQNSQRSGRAAMSQSQSRKSADADETARYLMSTDSSSGGGQSPFSGGKVQSDSALKANKYYDARMNQIAIQTIQRGHGTTLYKKQAQWVDAQLAQNADDEPEVTIDFASDEYWELVEDLSKQNRQWILSNRGDIYFMNHSKRVLVHNPK
jgi:Ca-activated chloride channel homolog